MNEITLPPVRRWTPGRKRDLLGTLLRGNVTRERAIEFYRLSPEELAEWETNFSRFGTAGLRATRTQQYRNG